MSGNVIFKIYKYTETVKWTKYPCNIISSHVTFYGKGRYKVEVNYSYEVNGQKYISDKYEITETTFNGKDAGNFINLYRAGTKTICYVNPEKPEEAVINNGLTSGFYAYLKILIVFTIFIIIIILIKPHQP